MLRIEREHEVRPGIWAWKAFSPSSGQSLSGKSRQPLSDACRELKASGELTAAIVGMFRNGTNEPSLISTVGKAAAVVVRETEGAPRFIWWKPHEKGTAPMPDLDETEGQPATAPPVTTTEPMPATEPDPMPPPNPPSEPASEPPPAEPVAPAIPRIG
jgi:hypothetical protein